MTVINGKKNRTTLYRLCFAILLHAMSMSLYIVPLKDHQP